jgi:UDP-glucuronate 4-epimerase
VLSTHADIERASRLLGYKPSTSLEEGLRKFVKWFKSPLFKDEYATDGLWRTGGAWDRYGM